MKESITVLAIAALIFGCFPTIGARPLKKRNNCTFNPDPNCMPFYNDFPSNSTYDDLSPFSDITSYNNIYYNGFKVIPVPEDTTKTHLVPATSSNVLRAHDSSISNTTQITSAGTILKFNSFYWGCEKLSSGEPVPCTLTITGYVPIPPGDPWLIVNSLVLEYNSTAGVNGTTELQYVGQDTLRALTLAYLFVFETSSTKYGVHPRLILDSVEAVYYEQFGTIGIVNGSRSV